MIIKVGNAADILTELHTHYAIKDLWSNQETWNGWTYEHDKAVKRCCKAYNISWHEPVQNLVVPWLYDRDGCAVHWYNQMKQPVIDKHLSLATVEVLIDVLSSHTELRLSEDGLRNLQKGRHTQGFTLLNSVLYEQGESYTKEMSPTVNAFESYSRFSAHLAFGALSIRKVFQAYQKRAHYIKQMPHGQKGQWPSAMLSFSEWLNWHCHFIQKLKDELRIEFKNIHSAYDYLREHDFKNDYFEACKVNITGYEMVDACISDLIAWLNFPMWTMVIIFASYHLWLQWRKPELYLLNLFAYYDPGIHYSQAQVQSGTTEISAIRIYKPIKQGINRDPEGVFISHWIPELREMNQGFIHIRWQAAWQMNGYTIPIAHEKTARKSAAEKLYGLRKNSIMHKDTVQKLLANMTVVSLICKVQ